MKGLQNRLLQCLGEEGVFVWRLVATDARVENFSLAEEPVKETEGAVRDFEGARFVDCAVEGELDSFDEVEGYGVFEAAETL